MPPPRSAACCWPTAPPATSRTAPAASAWPTAAGERQRGRSERSAAAPGSLGAGGAAGAAPGPRWLTALSPSAAAPWSWSRSGSSPSCGGQRRTRLWRGTRWPMWTTRPRCRWTAPCRQRTMESTGNNSGRGQLGAAARALLIPAAPAGASWGPGTWVKQGLAVLSVPGSAYSSFQGAGPGLGMIAVGLFLLCSVSGLKEIMN